MFIKKLIEYIYNLKKRIINKRKFRRRVSQWRKKLDIPKVRKAYIIGSPEYTNLGDSAIFIAQKRFLEKCGYGADCVKEITYSEYLNNRKEIRCAIKRNALICGIGGGNMGNQWPREELLREKMIRDFEKNEIIIFPQTLFFVSGSEEDEKRTAEYYNSHKKLTLTAREKTSEELMKKLYPEAKIILTPDIVLSTEAEDFGAKQTERKGVLFCIRDDIEKTVDSMVWEKLESSVEEKGLSHRKTDMHSDCKVTKENRNECVRKKMQEFCEAELVITDRLHAMVFAALTGTPCIVFSNYNHKVKGTYEWISYLPFIRYVETVEEAEKLIPSLLAMKNCRFDNEKLLSKFEVLEKVVKRKCRK